MIQEQAAKTYHPGIIVVDANQLLELSTPYPKESVVGGSKLDQLRRTPNATGSYLDLLPLLAAQGWQIKIPAAVMYRAADILPNGKTLGDYGFHFPTKTISKELQDFCRNVVHRKYDGVEMVPPGEGTQVAQFLDRIMASVNNLAPGPTLNHKIIDIQGEYRLSQLGSHHCQDVILERIRNLKADTTVPIFYLSSNVGIASNLGYELDKVVSDRPFSIGRVTVGGLLAALDSDKANGLSALTILGLRGGGSKQWDQIVKHVDKLNKSWLEVPYSPTEGRVYDRSVLRGGGEQKPFMEAVSGLATRLATRAPAASAPVADRVVPEEPVTPSAPAVSPRVAKFLKHKEFAEKHSKNPGSNGNSGPTP